MSNSDSCEAGNSIDINDAFDSVVFVEENLTSSGFKEGLQKGKSVGEFEGYHLGYHRGAELGSELGFYKGFLEALLSTADTTTLTNHKKIVEKFMRLIESFPKCNDDTVDIISLRDSIRSTYKRLCSLLKTDPQIPEHTKLTF